MTSPSTLLRDARRRAGISQAEVSRRSGIEQSTISRIEAATSDPGWETMTAALEASGWTVKIERSPTASLIPTREIAKSIRGWLRGGEEWTAMLDMVEAAGRIRALGALPEGGLPRWAVEEPASTGDRKWDTLLATGLAYSIEMIGGTPETWMDNVPPLSEPTMLTRDDPGDEYRARLRVQTPARFLAKNILTRDRDWTTA
jgi:transcriptional regulator with XRE-family HTH domain